MCFITVALTASMVIGAACSKKNTGKVEFKTDNEKMSYIFGTQVGSSFKDMKSKGYELNIDLFQRGMKDALDSAKLALSDSQMAQAMQQFQETMRKKEEEKFQKDLAENQLKASKFLAENAGKAGVVTLPPDSLQYQELKAGTGPQAKAGQTVKVNYKGSFIDGTEFDSSVKHGQPLEFTLGQPGMISGFSEAVTMMKVGSTWKVFIPPKLGYGNRGSQAIPPNALLIFEIELLEISKQAAPAGKK
jgi:FKBP-type peptidyl-prolyl cis-trans isomerase